MDINTDPRLQQFTYDNHPFAFQPQSPGAPDHLDPYDNGLAYNIPNHQRGQEQVWSGNAIPQHMNNTLHGVSNDDGSPQTRLRNPRGNQQLPSNRTSTGTPIELAQQRTSTPTRRPNQRSNAPIVFKNSSSTYPHGATAVHSNDPSLDNTNIYLPLGQNNPNSANYFSTTTTQPQSTTALPAELLPSNENPLPPAKPATIDATTTTTAAPSSANPFSPTHPLIPHPPDLALWRHRLFNIPTPLHLTAAQFLTYFPHIDNVYSHRSTQKYKRKPFTSHYWDCRLKGRPSGTKKSDDPNKKKRKREKRERDLCDVKIKITEWFSEAECREMGVEREVPGSGTGDGGWRIVLEGGGGGQQGEVVNAGDASGEAGRKMWPEGHPGADGGKWYTIQRVNGSAHSNAAIGQGEDGDEEDGGGDGGEGQDLDHKHTLEESDRIKKNSVQRWLIKEEKEKRASGKKKADTSSPSTNPALPAFYRATGAAHLTLTSHLTPAPTHLSFFANTYCPFAQRIWIALEIKGIAYQYVEVLPPTLTSPPMPLPAALLEVNPEGTVPCLRHGSWGVWESSVMMEYLEDLESSVSLLPQGRGSAQLRAHCRLWVDHLERKVLPAFYAVLLMPPRSETETESQRENREVLMRTLHVGITKMVDASHAIGPFFLGEAISYVDVMFAPWILRLSRVLERFRGWKRPEVGTRWQSWVNAVEGDERVRRTVCKDESYHSVYRGVAEDGWQEEDWGRNRKKSMLEMAYARQVIRREGFGLGGDLYGRLGADPEP